MRFQLLELLGPIQTHAFHDGPHGDKGLSLVETADEFGTVELDVDDSSSH